MTDTSRAMRHMVVSQMPGIDGDGITTAEKVQLVNEVAATAVEAALLSYNLYDPSDPKYGAVRSTSDPGASVKAANTAAIQQAANDARDNDGMLVIKGRYWIDGEIQVRSHLDGRSGEIHIADTGNVTALLYGVRTTGAVSVTRQLWAHFPKIFQRGKSGTGWSGTDVGLEISNCYACDFTIPEVNGFSTNLWFSAYGTGNVMNRIMLGFIYQGKIGIKLKPWDSSPIGWVNQNTFIGGQVGIQSGEGTNIPGAKYIEISDHATNPGNSNTFIGTDFENQQPQYRVHCFGFDNMFINCRWERTPCPVVFDGSLATANRIIGGNNDRFMDFQEINGARWNVRDIGSGYKGLLPGGTEGVMVIGNSGSENWPALSVVAPGGGYFGDPATKYSMQVSARETRFKAPDDAHPQVYVDHNNGRMYFGRGSSSPTTYLAESAFGGMLIVSPGSAIRTGASSPIMPQGVGPTVMAGTADPNGSATASPGSIYLRSNGTIYRKGTGTGNTGWVEMS